jgi:2-(1,2-epoxy-1,2-dihydrophenyl)acetyl-CoA isomerase
MSEFIKTEKIGSVYKITLNRPEKFNSLNAEMSNQLKAALDIAASDSSIRAVYLTGEGKAFCAGQDLSDINMTAVADSIERAVREQYNPLVLKLRALEKPVICAVNGVAAGAGASLALACDIVIAATSVSFVQAFSKIGLVPDCGGTYFLPRLVGLGKATALMMLGEKLSAADAEKMGMIYKVVEDDMLHQTAMATATTLADMPTKALGLTKRLLNQSMVNTLHMQLESEAVIQAKAATTKDFGEGVAAFLGKRKPVFKGE